MQRQTFLRLSAYLGSGIILGLIFGQASVFGLIALVGLVAISYAAALLVIVVAGLRREMPGWTFVFGFISLSLTVSVFVAFATLKYKREKKQERAEGLIDVIEEHKTHKGVYPKTLTSFQDLDKDDLQTFYYSTDSSQTNFEISYSVDGWHVMAWRSEQKAWEDRD